MLWVLKSTQNIYNFTLKIINLNLGTYHTCTTYLLENLNALVQEILYLSYFRLQP